MTARSPSNLKEASRKESHVSMAIYYVCCIGASGCLLPFLGKTLERSGFSPGQMSLLLALLPISQFIFPPLWAAYADRYQRRTLLMGLSPILAALFAAAMALQLSPFFATVVIILGFCIFFTPVIPLADAHTNASVGKNLETFGRIRVWGSVAFAGCAGALGWLHISDRPQLQWLLVAGAYVLTAISSRLLKAEGAKPDPLPGGRNDDRQRPSSQDSAIPFGDQVKQYFTRPEVILIIAASTLYFFGHGAFEIFFSVHLGHLGFDDRFIGMAWFLGLCVEIVLMRSIPNHIGKWSLQKTLTICALINSIRWIVIAFATSGIAILAIQTLHALTFGVWYLALNMIVHRKTEPDFKAMTQISVAGSVAGGRLLSYILGPVIMSAYTGRGLFTLAALLSLTATVIYMNNRID